MKYNIDLLCRLNLIFWVTGFFPDVKHASLTDGSDVTSLQIRNIDTPGIIALSHNINAANLVTIVVELLLYVRVRAHNNMELII